MSVRSFFRASIFHCVENNAHVHAEYFEDGLMVVKDGCVETLGAYHALLPQLSADTVVKHLDNTLIMPGFIDTHIHYPQYRILGCYGEDLMGWLNKYTFAEEAKFNAEQYALKTAQLFFDELIRNGTTTAMSFCTSHPTSVDAFFTQALKRGLRMIGGKVMMDRNAPAALCDDAESGYQDSKKLIENWHGKGRLSYALTPRFAPTSTPEQLKRVGDLRQQYPDLLLQTHMNETFDEIAWVRRLFPERQGYGDVYDHYQLLGEKSVLGHCVHNTQDELKRLAETGSKVALCPRSNLFLGSGLFNLTSLFDVGIDCALASDVGGGDSFSMFQVMNEAYKVSRLNKVDLDAVTAFYLTTLSAAKVLNMEHILGNFEKGKEADFIMIDLHGSPILKEKLSVKQPISDILFSLMMLGDDRLIKAVFVMGECIYKRDKQNQNQHNQHNKQKGYDPCQQ